MRGRILTAALGGIVAAVLPLAAGAKTALKAMASFDPKVKPDQIDLSRTCTNEFTRKALAKVR